MEKLYTLNEDILRRKAEVRVGDKCYPVDDRQKTVKKMMALVRDGSDASGAEAVDQAMKLALGDAAFAELDAMDLPFAAYQRLFALVIDAVTGQESGAAGRFPKKG